MRPLTALFLIVATALAVNAQEQKLSPSTVLPVDPKITVGHLDNGLTYLIRENEKPEDRAQLWLVVNAGSILEDKDQQGLAHFTEHMAFNGTKHFAKQELVNYLESIGMKFGPEVNAYTSFDETVFMLQVPTDSIELMDKGLLILEDWAHNVSFDDEEIDKERGVVIEEWRLGRGANMRMLNKQLPIIFKGSRYADRLPIGKKEVLDTFHYATVKRFYHDWYRPDLMAVIAVGDFDKDWMEKRIRTHFSGIKGPDNPRPRKKYGVPDNKETLFAIATDPEATYTIASVYYKSEPFEATTVGEYRVLLLEQLFSRMFNQRLYELLNQPDPPFLVSYTGKSDLVRTKSVYTLNAAVKEDGIEKGLEALLTEAQRVREFGFTQAELERAKTKILRQYEQSYQEREKSESRSFASEYSRHFLQGECVPGIEYEYRMAKQMVPEIGLSEVNHLIEEWITENNRVVLLNAPERAKIPEKSDLMAVFDKVEDKELNAYTDEFSDQPLVEKVPEPGKIVSRKTIDTLGVTEWTLGNGVRVVLKPTDFKNDQILFRAFSPGGTSLASDKDYVSADMATDLIKESGVGNFGKTDLDKKLGDKIVSVSPTISTLDEGFSGSSSNQDIETMFQLIYLYMTGPRIDSTGFLSYRSRMKGIVENRSADPESAFYDTLMVTMASHSPRVIPWSQERLDEMDMKTSWDFYRDRFADASDFTFFFVGSFSIDDIRPLVREYLGNLPSTGRIEHWKDPGIRPPKGVVKKEVRKGIEAKSRVNITFTGPFDYSRENNYELNSMTSVLRIKLREVLREDLGGTYGVGISSTSSRYPRQEYRITVNFGCAPDRVQELISNVFLVMDTLRSEGPDDEYIEKVSEIQKRSYETNLKENRFWLSSLYNAYYLDRDPIIIYQYPDLFESLNKEMIRETADRYLDTNRYVQVILYPEGFE